MIDDLKARCLVLPYSTALSTAQLQPILQPAQVPSPRCCQLLRPRTCGLLMTPGFLKPYLPVINKFCLHICVHTRACSCWYAERCPGGWALRVTLSLPCQGFLSPGRWRCFDSHALFSICAMGLWGKGPVFIMPLPTESLYFICSLL